ncbi:acetyl-CoA C-acetyltransferase [Bordetella pseudohinzii]|nr:acetyl-CoA C-acetyltransferase [Bordetella pseudohinzii]KMM25284.1 acetyl-CoA acetyltransferase [Bordetella pseudohinzii]KXA78705.1 acetyl-CoA acetyltransferase [Bordetella pseudohinzii]KXA81285.1 acetyl-CoA acetyltransferase [Bordetella pseudohinzii]CUJ05489.1 Putative acyltransferase Rv0859 [Bordetella pseudohinzii]
MQAYIYDAVRTPRGRGKANGALHTLSPLELGAAVLRAVPQRGGFAPQALDEVILGCVEAVDDQGANLARSAALAAGYGDSVPGFMVARFCGSALDAVNAAAAKVMAGQADGVVAGGVEMNSLVPMLVGTGGPSVSDVFFNDLVLQTPQGVAADLIATLEDFGRDDVDAYAAASHARAARAQREGWFEGSLVPVHDANGALMLAHDELVRPETTVQSLAQLKPSFAESGEKLGFDATVRYRYAGVDSIRHVHHAGNSSGIADGASAVLVGSAAFGKQAGLRPRARILATASAGTDPCLMLTAPVPASQRCLARAGLTAADIDLFEVNEAFASVVLHYMRHMDVPQEKINVAGGAIALGHPVGATGGMLVGMALDELERRGARRALVTMCTGLGMAVATLIERVAQ